MELDRLGEVLVDTLHTFKIQSEISGRTTGPAVTQYEVVPAAGVKVNRIANLDADLALAMKARSVRIVAPIPGKGAIGVEIPNPRPEMVRLREILEAPVFARSRGLLPLALGKDLTGHPFVADLTKMPHALIAGATGSGKSVCLNTIITSLVYRHGPDRMRLLLIDPKMVGTVCVRRPSPFASPGGDGPERRGRRPEMGGVGDGAALLPAERERCPLAHGVQRAPRSGHEDEAGHP